MTRPEYAAAKAMADGYDAAIRWLRAEEAHRRAVHLAMGGRAGRPRRNKIPSEAKEQTSSTETCRRCGGQNVVWCAPSPLWNMVMRGNDIDGNPLFGDLVCMACFVALADDLGLSGQWRLSLTPEPPGLIFETPSGRKWDAGSWLWTP